MSAAGRPEWVKCYLNEMEASSHFKPERNENGKSTSRHFSIMQHPLKFGCVKPFEITGVRPFFFLFSRRETSEYALIIGASA